MAMPMPKRRLRPFGGEERVISQRAGTRNPIRPNMTLASFHSQQVLQLTEVCKQRAEKMSHENMNGNNQRREGAEINKHAKLH
jgi:hypothetical protein